MFRKFPRAMVDFYHISEQFYRVTRHRGTYNYHFRSVSCFGRTAVTPETNKRVMHRFTEFINTANEKLAQELISPDAIFHVPGRAAPVRGPAGYLEIIGMMRGGFPDIQWTLEEMVAEGDRVAARFTMRGTHRGIFFGVPPTGRTIKVQAMNFYRLSGGRFVEERGQPDLLSLLQQIGAVPMA
jgi:steroid delta-isomerase-like uncharacterized protein